MTKLPIRLVSKHMGLICGNDTCSVYLMLSKHLLKHESTRAIKIFLYDDYLPRNKNITTIKENGEKKNNRRLLLDIIMIK